MAGRVLTIVGAGSLRCAPAVFASLCAPRFEHSLEVRLFDANIERLDLMGRLLARMFELTRAQHVFAMHPNLGLSLRGADGAVLTLYEDCARRMTGKTATRVLLPSEPAESGKLEDLNRGDLNRPTPFDELSPMTLAALSTPEGGGRTRDEVVANAMALTIERIETGTVLLNLTRNAPISPTVPHKAIDWPEPLEPGSHTALPHRVLRWIGGDHELEGFMEGHRHSPVARWLTDEFGAL
jgi:hypothetical protein